MNPPRTQELGPLRGRSMASMFSLINQQVDLQVKREQPMAFLHGTRNLKSTDIGGLRIQGVLCRQPATLSMRKPC